MVCYNRPHQSKFFKDCIPQMLLGPFVNALFHVFRPFQTSTTERFTKMVSSVNLKLLTFSQKGSFQKLKWVQNSSPQVDRTNSNR